MHRMGLSWKHAPGLITACAVLALAFVVAVGAPAAAEDAADEAGGAAHDAMAAAEAAPKTDVNAALRRAAEAGDLPAVQRLLRGEVDWASRSNDMRTALHLAILSADESRMRDYGAVVDALLAAGFRLGDVADRGRRAVHLARQPAMIEHLLERGADVNARTMTDEATPLHLACRDKDVERVRCLLAHGADPNAADRHGGTPLHVALRNADERSQAIAALLRGRGAADDVFTQALEGRTDAVLGALDKQPDLLTARTAGGATLLHIAAEQGNLDLVKALLERRADLRAADAAAGWTPLHYAARHGRAAVVDTLLLRGAQANAAGDYRTTALHVAVRRGHADVVRILCDAAGKSPINTEDEWGYAPLHLAASAGHVAAVRELLEHRAQVNRNCENRTALDVAADGGHLEVVRLLLEHGADPSASPDTSSPPLHEAAALGSMPLVRVLLDGGVDVNTLNDDGRTALDWAEEHGHREVAEALKAAGGVPGDSLVGPQRVADLVRQLGDDSYRVRERADAALRDIAPRIQPMLRDALKNAKDLERRIRLEWIIESAQ